VHSRETGSGAAETRRRHQVFLQNPTQEETEDIIRKDGRETYRSLEGNVVHLEKGGSGPAEDVAGGKSELEGAAHEEAPEDAAVHVALLRLAQERVLQARVADQHAGREGFGGFRRFGKFNGCRSRRRGRMRFLVQRTCWSKECCRKMVWEA
jgi:hypothetical protein